MTRLEQYIYEHDTVQKAIGLFAPNGHNAIEGLNIIASRFDTFKPRDWQEPLINNLILNKSVLVQVPVGYGKTIIFQNAIAQSRDLAYIIMPTIALALDMHKRFKKIGAKVAIWSSVTSKEDREHFRANIDDYHAVIFAPEAMDTIPVLQGGLLIVDEAHNITMSASYRASFSKIGKFRHKIKARAVGLFSATMNNEMIKDIERQFFGINFIQYRHKNPDRPNLKYHTPRDIGYSIEEIYELFEKNKGRSAIFYAYKVDSVENMAAAMRSRLMDMGYEVVVFHSKVKNKTEKMKTFQEKSTAVFATSAFGEGIDKKDIGLIIRLGFPFSITQLVQEAGRAERGGEQDGHYYMYRMGDEKKMFNYNKISKSDIEGVLKNISMVQFEEYKFKNFIKESAALTFLEKVDMIISDVQKKVFYSIKLTGKEYKSRPYAWFIKELSSKVTWRQEDLEDINDNWKEDLKKAKASGYITVDPPSQNKRYKKLGNELTYRAEDELKKHNEEVEKEYQDIMSFFTAQDKKKYIEQYFEEE